MGGTTNEYLEFVGTSYSCAEQMLRKTSSCVIAAEQLGVTVDVPTRGENVQLPSWMGYTILMYSPGVRTSFGTEAFCETVRTQLDQNAQSMSFSYL